ncbi:MAG: hypothetical protein RL628_1662 [Actinomycetota bacterium]
MTPLETVNAFIQAIENRNVDAAIALVSDNCEYDNLSALIANTTMCRWVKFSDLRQSRRCSSQ